MVRFHYKLGFQVNNNRHSNITSIRFHIKVHDILAKYGDCDFSKLDQHGWWQKRRRSRAMGQSHNFLICLEMLLFSIAHFYCFPTDEWEAGYRPTKEKRMSAGDNLALGDFVNDLRLMLRGSDIALDNKMRSKKMSTKNKVDDDIDLLSTVYEDTKAEDEIDVKREEGVSDVEHQNDTFDHEGVVFDQQVDDADLTIRRGDLKRQKRTLEKRLFNFRQKK